MDKSLLFKIEADGLDICKQFIEQVRQAELEAIKQNINANAVYINDKLLYSKLVHPSLLGEVPMICGLKCVPTDELPDNILFAVCEGHNLPLTKDEQIQKLKEENLMLQEKLNKISDLIEEVV